MDQATKLGSAHFWPKAWPAQLSGWTTGSTNAITQDSTIAALMMISTHSADADSEPYGAEPAA